MEQTYPVYEKSAAVTSSAAKPDGLGLSETCCWF